MIPLFRLRQDQARAGDFAEMSIASEVRLTRCRTCKQSQGELSSPFLLMRSYDRWDPNLGEIPDFLFVGVYRVVSDRAKCFLEARSEHLQFIPAPVVENPERLKQFRRDKRGEFQRELERDQETPLWRLRVGAVATMNLAASGRSVEFVCPECGFIKVNIAPGSQIVLGATERRQRGLFKIRQLIDQKLFRDEYYGAAYCTDELSQAIGSSGLTNVFCFKAGYCE
jgi:hypothetical protein